MDRFFIDNNTIALFYVINGGRDGVDRIENNGQKQQWIEIYKKKKNNCKNFKNWVYKYTDSMSRIQLSSNYRKAII